MRHDYIDRYARLDSPVHRLPAGVKLAGALIVICTTLAVPFSIVPYFSVVAVLLLILLILSRVPLFFVLSRMLLLEPFVLGVTFLALFQPEGGTMALKLLVKSNIGLAVMVLLSNTTPFAAILDVLRKLRTPPLLVTVLALMYRYVFLMIDQAERMSRARRSRTFVRRPLMSWTHAAGIIGHLFIRSTERAERIYAAMTARGWQ